MKKNEAINKFGNPFGNHLNKKMTGMKMASMELDRLKDAFTSLVGQAEPSVLPAFLLWVDIKVSEYKTNGYMYSDPTSHYEGPWLRFAVDTVKYKLGDNKTSRAEATSKYHGMSSPDTTVQTEALELTKSPEKTTNSFASDRDVNTYSARTKEEMYDYSHINSAKVNLNETAYSKESSMYANYSPYKSNYYAEEDGIINLSVKSSQPCQSSQNNTVSDTTQPLKLNLKVPSYNMGSPIKASSVETSPVKPESNTLSAMSTNPNISDGYSSSLRSLLQATKFADLPPTGLLTSQLHSSQLTASPIKSDNDSCASSPGPVDFEGKDRKDNDCPYCGKTFQYRSSYRRHLKIHQGVYTHICAACSRKFTRKEHFIRHKCNRKPNIPNRSALRVELNPDAIPMDGKLPIPKVAYPPNLDDQVSEHKMQEALNNSATVKEEGDNSSPSLNIDEDMPKCNNNESRRKKSQPRKVLPVVPEEGKGNSFIADIDDDMNDLMQAYDSPVGTPERDDVQQNNIESKNDDAPEDLSKKVDIDAADRRMDQNLPLSFDETIPQKEEVANAVNSSSEETTGQIKPIEIMPMENMGSDMISTATGTYQIEQVHNDTECIKVTKQSNYLKLRKEAQLINGQLCFVCPHCTKVFHRSSNFSRHMRIHRGVYSYICPSCNRGFYRKEHFQKHKCARKSMSRIWSRKTKLDIEVPDLEKENLADVEGLEEGIDLGSDTGDDDQSEEGSLVVDESAGEETMETSSFPGSAIPQSVGNVNQSVIMPIPQPSTC